MKIIKINSFMILREAHKPKYMKYKNISIEF